jgi:molybdopterin/thiamine biosynthesis adenylyltransferase/molybdopterin synthase catalytic subunit/rhodanese-related sulfurtransferase
MLLSLFRPWLEVDMFAFSSTSLDSSQLAKSLINPKAGALVTFEGWVRNHNDGHQVLALAYEACESLAIKEALRIIEEAKTKFDVYDLVCVHRTGTLAIGEMAVWVGAISAHRGTAFSACQYVIDQIKHRVPIWKKETYVDGTSGWVNCHDHSPATKTAVPSFTEPEYYARQIALSDVGCSGQEKLRNARVLVIGAGGLGCPALSYLAAAGVGTIGICDDDTVDVSNLHRQVLYTMNDVGSSKAVCAANRLKALNPFIDIRVHPERFTSATATSLFSDYDFALDCSDNFETKFAANDAALLSGITLVQASVYQYEGQLHFVSRSDAPVKPPLPAVSTNRANAVSSNRANAVSIEPANAVSPVHANAVSPDVANADNAYAGQCLRCLWPDVSDSATELSCIGSCAEVGVLGVIPGALGTLQAGETIKLILGLPTSLRDKVLIFDLLSYQTRLIKRRINPTCSCQQPVELDFARTRIQGDTSSPVVEIETARTMTNLSIVDVRELSETEASKINPSDLWAGTAVAHLPLSVLDEKLTQLNPEDTYLLVCARGKRSLVAANKMREKGFRNVYSLSGGINSLGKGTVAHSERL